MEHQHRGIRYVSLAQRYESAGRRHLASTRDWTPILAPSLTPDRDSVVATHLQITDKRLHAS
jgi:hypothetical protein